MEHGDETTPHPTLLQPILRIMPREEPLREGDGYGPTGHVRHGTEVSLVTPTGETTFSKTVWERGSRLPFIPFYEMRVLRARNEAARIAGNLALESSTG